MPNQGFPALSGVVDAAQLRANLSGLIARNSAGAVRTGVFPRSGSTLVSGTPGLAYAVSDFEGVVLLDSEPVLISLRGTESVSTEPPPAANSRIDLICIRQGPETAELFVRQGTAAPNPIRPSVPTGAIELGSARMVANATNTAGLTFTNSMQFTAASGGVMRVHNEADLNGWTPADGNWAYRVDEGISYERRGGAWTARPHPVFARIEGAGSAASGTTTNGMAPQTSYSSDTNVLETGNNGIIARRSGWYRITASVNWQTNATGSRWIFITIDNTSTVGDRRTASGPSNASVSDMVRLTAGQAVRAAVTQDSGAARTYGLRLMVEFVGSGGGMQ